MDSNTILTPLETAEILDCLKVSKSESGISDIMENLYKAVETLAIKERNKIPHKAQLYGSCNQKPFTTLIIKRFGRDNVFQFTHDGIKSIDINVGGYKLTLEISDDHVDVEFDWHVKLEIGLHCDSYNDVMHFIFDEDSEFNKLFVTYSQVKQSLEYYLERYSALSKTSRFQSALRDETAYNVLRESYNGLVTEMQPLGEYMPFKKWEDFFRSHAVNFHLNEIAGIRAVLTDKPELSYKYSKKYNKALSVLECACKYDLLTAEEMLLIEPWEKFLSSVGGEDTLKVQANDSYKDTVAMIFEQKLQDCEKRATPYMRKKKEKIGADMELCKTLKSLHGLDCFIDKSHFKASVNHFNVISDDNTVWVFRIGSSTPSTETCTKYIAIVKVLEQIGSAIGKKVNFKKTGFRYASGKLYVQAFGIEQKVVEKFSELLKEIKNGRLEITHSHVCVILPAGELEWQISLAYETAEETIIRSMPLIKQYLALYRNGKDISIKGIFKERIPNL